MWHIRAVKQEWRSDGVNGITASCYWLCSDCQSLMYARCLAVSQSRNSVMSRHNINYKYNSDLNWMKTSINILSPHPVTLKKNLEQHRGRFVWGRFDRQTWWRFGHTPGDILVLGMFWLDTTQNNAQCYFPSLWTDKCKAQALFSVRGGRKQENQV